METRLELDEINIFAPADGEDHFEFSTPIHTHGVGYISSEEAKKIAIFILNNL